MKHFTFLGGETTLVIGYDKAEGNLELSIDQGDVTVVKNIKDVDITAFFAAIDDLRDNSSGNQSRFLYYLESQVRNNPRKEGDIDLKSETGNIDSPAFLTEINLLQPKYSTTQKVEAKVFIGLPQKEIDLFTIELIQNATGNFMEAMGFELETKDQPVYGSFFQDLKFFFKGKGRQEATEVYQKGKTAFELQYIGLPSAESTSKLATAAAGLISALDNVNEGVLRLGGLLLIKTTIDGAPRILAETVSPELALLLDKNPQLLENPNTVFSMITAMQAGSKRIEATGAGQAMQIE